MQRGRLPWRYCRMQEFWAFVFSGFGAVVVLVSIAVVIGARLLAWWSRKID
ncbi:MAG TPA: hypothetical protein VFZ38_04195 [Vicinamibacterales bacterium]